jgi:alpha-beta hydrolase superfamily lysophospholipase
MRTQIDLVETKDKLTLQVVTWLPDDTPRAALLLAHGIGEHSARYTHVAQALTDAGYAVYSMDYRGHGKSEGIRSYFDDFSAPVDDLEARFDAMRSAHPDLKHFVFGHSMGALLSLLLVLRRQADIAGWITEGTPLHVEQTVPGFVVGLAGLLTNVIPRARAIPLDFNALSRDEAVVAAYKADPLVDAKPTRIGMAYRLIKAAQGASQKLTQITLPVLIVHGGKDTICPPSGSQLIYDRSASDDKAIKFYDNAYHEIHNEPEQTEFLQDIITWLNAH